VNNFDGERPARTGGLLFESSLKNQVRRINRRSVPAVIKSNNVGAFGTKHFAIPFDAIGKARVRFAVWDTAGNGAFVQPVWLNAPKTTIE